MNSQDKSNHHGLDALRSEVAPADLQSKILIALQPARRRTRRLNVLKISLATVVAGGLVITGLLAPRASLAAAVSRVLKTFQMIRRYHVKSYESIDGQQRLASELWVNGAKRRFVVYGPDGKPIPDASEMIDIAAKMDKMLRGLSPKQFIDPALKDKLLKQTAPLGPNAGVITSQWTVDGQPVSDVPEGVKKAIADGLATRSVMFNIGGEPDVTYLCGLLKNPSIWEITGGQMLDGKKVDKYEFKAAGVTLFVDPATSLPLRMQMKTSLSGQAITSIDDFDYPISGP